MHSLADNFQCILHTQNVARVNTDILNSIRFLNETTVHISSQDFDETIDTKSDCRWWTDFKVELKEPAYALSKCTF